MVQETDRSLFAVWISLISNILLTAIKLFVGLMFHSEVLLADGVHNAGDIVATAAALGSMNISKRPADEDHPYGHGKAEVLGSGFVAVILGLAALYIGYHSIAIFFEKPAAASYVALVAAIVSLVWKYVLYAYTIRIGRKANSKGLLATAQDHLADVYASLAAVAGIGLSLIGEAYHIRILAFGDPVAGIIVAFLVLKLAFEMGKEAFDILMEKAVDPIQLGHYAEIIMAVPEVRRIDRLRAREHGRYILVDVRVSVAAELTIQQGHDIARHIKRSIMDDNPVVGEVLIHLNPWYDTDPT
jgi:cation diffusion facilitator family transporter